MAGSLSGGHHEDSYILIAYSTAKPGLPYPVFLTPNSLYLQDFAFASDELWLYSVGKIIKLLKIILNIVFVFQSIGIPPHLRSNSKISELKIPTAQG